MIATGIAEAAGMRRLLVPHMSAVFSAFGIGFSNLAHEYQAPLQNGDGEDLVALRESMLVRARHDMFGEGVDQDACAYDCLLWSAVDGQAVEKPLNGAAPEFDPAASEHRLVVKATYRLPTFALVGDDGATRPAGDPTTHAHVRTAADSAENVPVYLADGLEAGATFTGPALLRSPYLTCLLRPGWSLRATRNGDYMIEVA
jgi:N-methylhydantoinase A/oxoprolinase/acetone carboxylase beta subunit